MHKFEFKCNSFCLGANVAKRQLFQVANDETRFPLYLLCKKRPILFDLSLPSLLSFVGYDDEDDVDSLVQNQTMEVMMVGRRVRYQPYEMTVKDLTDKE